MVTVASERPSVCHVKGLFRVDPDIRAYSLMSTGRVCDDRVAASAINSDYRAISPDLQTRLNAPGGDHTKRTELPAAVSLAERAAMLRESSGES